MPQSTANLHLLGKPRAKYIPPHVPLRALRIVAGMSLETLADHVGEITGTTPSRGSLSAVETGARGASAEILNAIEAVFGLEPGTIDTTYKPRARRDLA